MKNHSNLAPVNVRKARLRQEKRKKILREQKLADKRNYV